jgi:hypothetical protein
LYERTTEATGLWVAEEPELKTRPLLKGSAATKNGQFSPDGKWVAYTSNESGKWEVYVTSFPELRGKGKSPITGELSRAGEETARSCFTLVQRAE